MNPELFITRHPYDVQVLANGVDISARQPLVEVRYAADGTGTRRLRDGRVVTGSWRFLNAAKTQMEVVGPEGPSRWVLVELNERVYRKVNLDTGVELVHRPQAQA